MGQMFSKKSFQLTSLGVHCDFLKLGIPAVIANMVIIFLCFPLSLLVYVLDGLLSKSLLHLYSSLYFSLSLLFPASLTFAVFQRQRLIITVLKNMKASEEPTRATDARLLAEKESVDKVRCLMWIYSNLLEVVDEISLCYGLPMLLVTAVIFSYSLMTNFVVYKEFVTTGTFSQTVASSMVYVFFYTTLYIWTLLMCSLTELKVCIER